MQKLRLDLLKLTGAKHFQSKDGTDHIAIPVEPNNIYVGAKGSYLDLSLLDNRDGRDSYDNDGFCAVDVGKQRREAGEKGQIIGNWKNVETRTPAHSSNEDRQKMRGSEPRNMAVPSNRQADDDDGIPF